MGVVTSTKPLTDPEPCRNHTEILAIHEHVLQNVLDIRQAVGQGRSLHSISEALGIRRES